MESNSRKAASTSAGAVESTSGEVEPDAPPSYTFARLGIAMLASEVPPTDTVHAATAIVRNLKADNRVVAVQAGQFDEHMIEWNLFYPTARGRTDVDMLSGADGFFSVHLALPVAFQVTVPEKNQPVIDGVEDVPTDTYWCAWDGRFLIVSWQQAEPSPAFSAGHVVLDVLEDALGSLGYAFYVPGCEYNCAFKFVHNTLLVQDVDESRDAWGFVQAEAPGQVLAVPDDAVSVPRLFPVLLYREISTVARDFVWVKNYGRRILDLDARVRRDHLDLLGLFAHNAERSTGRWYRRAWAVAFSRGWRRQARFLIASEWQGLAAIELVRSRWEDDLRDLEESEIARVVLGNDMTRDIERVNGMEFSGLLSALDQVMSHLDTRQVAVATTAGALGGAVAGALVGVFAA